MIYRAVNGEAINIFPIPDEINNKWITPYAYREGAYPVKDSLYGNFINTGFKAYLYMLNQGKQSGDFTESDKLLDAIKKSQQKVGAAVMLSDDKIEAEILYNKYDVFKKLFSWYMYAGTLMFVLLIIQIFKDKSRLI